MVTTPLRAYLDKGSAAIVISTMALAKIRSIRYDGQQGTRFAGVVEGLLKDLQGLEMAPKGIEEVSIAADYRGG